MTKKTSVLVFGYNEDGQPQARIQGSGAVVDFPPAQLAVVIDVEALEALYETLYASGKAKAIADAEALVAQLKAVEVP